MMSISTRERFARRYLRALGLGVGAFGLILCGVYWFTHWSAFAAPSHVNYRDISWDDLLKQRPPLPTSKSGKLLRVLGPDPWAKLADDVDSGIHRSIARQSDQPAPSQLELDGAAVRLAGYIVPLQDAPDRAVTEFFLVPYVGACIHVPPPPADQIVYINFPPGFRIENIYEAFQVRGTLHTQTLHTGLADTAYMMVADEVVRYDPQTAQ